MTIKCDTIKLPKMFTPFLYETSFLLAKVMSKQNERMRFLSQSND
jgi:hypothetical protein